MRLCKRCVSFQGEDHHNESDRTIEINKTVALKLFLDTLRYGKVVIRLER